MRSFRQFRRFLLLLLSLTLSAQSMAVTSLGACHNLRTLGALSSQVAVANSHHHESAASLHGGPLGKHGHESVADAHGGDTQNRAVQDGGRSACAACAACHLCTVVLPSSPLVVDIPVDGAASFPESAVPRVRNVASGLERPPRA